MNPTGNPMTAILVPIDKKTATRLLAQCGPGETLSDVISRLSKRENGKSKAVLARPVSKRAEKYVGTFLGEKIAASTLPEFFAKFVDLAARLDPVSMERLADMKARSRRYVSRRKEDIHPRRPDLPVMRTQSGWWISKNVGCDQVKKALQALAEATGLGFGTDIRFPVNSN